MRFITRISVENLLCKIRSSVPNSKKKICVLCQRNWTDAVILSKKPSNKSTRNGIRRFSRWRKLKKRCPGRRRTLLKSCLETTNFSISRQAIRNQLIEEADCTTIDLLFEYLITLPLISPSPIPASRISLGSRPNTSCFQCRTQ